MTFCFPKSLQDTESLHKSMLIPDINIFFFNFYYYYLFLHIYRWSSAKHEAANNFLILTQNWMMYHAHLRTKMLWYFKRNQCQLFSIIFLHWEGGGLVKRELLNLTFFLVKRKSYKGLISQRPQYKRSVKHCMYCQTVGKFTKHVRTGFP